MTTRRADVLEELPPGEVSLRGFLGTRAAKSEQNRLLAVDEEALLAGFRHRPGRQAWIGEHVGKWLHAATLAWAATGDPQLRAKLDRVVAELLKTQEADGYLGTYLPEQRFGLSRNADWDVWVHKYDLIGLLTYHRCTGNPAALAASRKIGDLLVRTFGPGKKSILAAGTHAGMAATSVLEPMMLLHRATGDPRYLEFGRYLVAAWDEPQGPRVMAALLAERAVQKTANAKAYEMLSNLVGLCELARATGDAKFLQPAVIAREDITANHLYLTGTASQGEHFHAPHDLPNAQAANVGETCVTTTWIQLNAQLLRLTGAPRYGDELERAYYNHLAAAQRPDGAQWCYFTSLEGTKPYGPGINCCVSSGPRAMALAPQLTYLKRREGGRDTLVVNFFERSTVTTELGGQPVTVEQETEFPRTMANGGEFRGSARLLIRTPRPATFGLQVRSPAWAAPLGLSVEGAKGGEAGPAGGWLTVPPRRWQTGDEVTLTFTVPARLVRGDYSNASRAALAYGPFVLALDEARNPALGPARAVGFTAQSAAGLRPRAVPGMPLAFEAPVEGRDGKPATAVLVPFAEAGSTGGRYAVWLRAPGVPRPANESLLGFGAESRSRPGNVMGSISDGDPTTFVVTFDGARREEDWFALELARPVTLRRVVFRHGRTFHDGGWWDTAGGKPRVEGRRQPGGPWEPLGRLEEYPATAATDPAGLKGGESFTLRLAQPVRALAVRVIGKPACGEAPNQAFASCAELEAFAD